MNEVTNKNGSSIARASIVTAAWHNPAARVLVVDVLAAVIATLLPWSMSGFVVFVLIWISWLSIALNPCTFLFQLKPPACSAPGMLFARALAGTLWSDAPANVRLHAVGTKFPA